MSLFDIIQVLLIHFSAFINLTYINVIRFKQALIFLYKIVNFILNSSQRLLDLRLVKEDPLTYVHLTQVLGHILLFPSRKMVKIIQKIPNLFISLMTLYT